MSRMSQKNHAFYVNELQTAARMLAKAKEFVLEDSLTCDHDANLCNCDRKQFVRDVDAVLEDWRWTVGLR